MRRLLIQHHPDPYRDKNCNISIIFHIYCQLQLLIRTMSEISSLIHKEREHSLHRKPSTFSKLKKHLAAIKQEWGPGIAAKVHWDDEYNFPPGRWAGQGIEPSYHRRS